MLDDVGIQFTPSYISQKLNVSLIESDRILKKLIAMQLIYLSNKSDIYHSKPVHIDDSADSSLSSVLCEAYKKTMYRTFSRMTTNDIFNFRLEILSKKVIKKSIPKLAQLIKKITEESKSEKSKEVYSFSQIFVEAKN